MKTNNTQHKAFAFLGAAFALLIALLFTACPNNAGDSGSGNSGGGGGMPVPKYAVNFGVEGTGGTLKAKADGVTETETSPITVQKGKTVTFTATPDAGYAVKEWKVDGAVVTDDTSNTYTCTVAAAADVKVSFGAPLVTGGVSLILSPSKLDIRVWVETADGTDVTVEGCTETSLPSAPETIPTLHAQSTTVVLKGNITVLSYSGFSDSNNGVIAANVQGLSDLKWLACYCNKLTAQALTQVLTDLPIRSPSDNAECYLYIEKPAEGNWTDFTSASAPQELKDAFQNAKTVKHWKLYKGDPMGYGKEI